MDQARNTKADIEFLLEDGSITQTAPLLRTAASYTWDTETTKAEFVAACVALGYNANTAGTCWHVGRKTMMEMEE
jgi:hypothetical protein